MKDQLITTFAGLAGIGVLLLAGIVAGTAGRLPVDAPLPDLVESVERDAGQAAEEADPTVKPRRRARTPLSMPYFSFAQSLRPRG